MQNEFTLMLYIKQYSVLKFYKITNKYLFLAENGIKILTELFTANVIAVVKKNVMAGRESSETVV